MQPQVISSPVTQPAPVAAQPSIQPQPAQPQTAQPQAPAAPASWPASPAYAPRSVAPTRPVNSVGGGAIPALPLEVESSNGITYITGGIGDEEMAELKAKKPEFNVHILFVAAKGEYISDIGLRIQSQGENGGNKLLLTADGVGPYFYATLQPGTYIVEASPQNQSAVKTFKFTVPAKGSVEEHITVSE
jgi:hypothetical protein